MKTVLCNGCFDLFHYGHLLHLQAARNIGDRLVVSITADAHVNKKGRPVIPAHERAAIVGALKCVDEAIIVTGMLDALQRVRPDIVAKGRDYKNLDAADRRFCEDNNIEMRFTQTPKFSSTEILNEARRRITV